MWILFGEVSSSFWCLGWAALFYCGTPWPFHIIISAAQTYKLISTDEKSVVNKHCNEIVTKFAIIITETLERHLMFYWLPRFHKRPYKACFIANSSSCTTTSLPKAVVTPNRAIQKS